MKIVHVTNHFYPCIGGIERVALDICNALIEKGHSVKIVTLNKCANTEKKLKAKENFGKIQIERIPFINLKYYKVATSVLGKIKEADIVHVHGIGFFSDFLILTKFIHKKPVVISTHGGIFHTKDLGFLKIIYFYGIQQILLRFANKVLAVSKNDLNKFGEISKKVELIENGIDIKRFKPGKKKKNTLLYVGRFSKNKRVEKLLETASILKKDFTLIIAGTDWENLLWKYKRLVSSLGLEKKVVFLIDPDDEQLKKLYSEAEFFVSASQYEGFGLTLVEAMASGCIPIVQKNNGFSKIITTEEGFLINYDNDLIAAKSLSKAISMGASKSKFSKKAIEKSKEFSWGNKIEKLEKLYSEIISYSNES